ncbi:MAG TPA: MBL fold metallo-hydrolase RNA specificity domain-containing protein [Candidatus Baltobacteraceae bacterium]|nr:MBL fold metallo-hydrolase RNA specificity domain-containing protein [Candidatus Baltobacteraceae bacterium]
MFTLAERSLYAQHIDLWIDSMTSRERCYVSHGHSDHAREHAIVVATANTARICRARFARRAQPRPQLSLLPRSERKRVEVTFEERAFNEPWEERDHRLTLFSAGHVLGSSQLMIEGASGRYVYTGDFKLSSSLTVEPPEVKPCDVLLMECTFGRPSYAFPPREEIAQGMIAFARRALEDGAVPVFFAYSLGKAQEAMAILGDAGLRLVVHSAVDAMSRVYLECGVRLPPFERYDPENGDADGVFVWPPGATLPKELRDRSVRTAILTGWALDRGALFRYGTQHGFALSDHADYPALLEYIERAQPRKVYLNHGWRDFVHRLKALGVDAEYLEQNAQLSLF